METATTQATTEATEVNVNQEVADKPTILNTDTTYNMPATVDPEECDLLPLASVPILDAISAIPTTSADPVHIINLKNVFEAAISNSDFVKDVKKVEKIIAALTLVDPETRVRAQLETNAYKTLRAKAAKIAEEPGGVYVAPTKAEIDKYIEDGLKLWRDKQK